MIKRELERKAKSLATQYPVLTITGPRQSGKTTLAQSCFSGHLYQSLESPDTRSFAQNDPRGFLAQSSHMIIDEIQRVPELTSYIQGFVDDDPIAGRFILTGSHQFELSQRINQSLAGRTAILKLLPFSFKELYNKTPLVEIDLLIYEGFYPRIHDQKLNPTEALSFYTNTYIERDVREIKQIANLRQFEGFIKLCAANIGSLVNMSRLGNDIGVDQKTIASWLSVMEASFIIFLLPPHFQNFRKRIVKSPKLYFYDVGLASYLLGIKEPNHIANHPLKGALFENFIVLEALKESYNRGADANLYFFRDHNGNEVDLLVDRGSYMRPLEIKLSQTINERFFKGLNYYAGLNPRVSQPTLIYTGQANQLRSGIHCLPYYEWAIDDSAFEGGNDDC